VAQRLWASTERLTWLLPLTIDKSSVILLSSIEGNMPPSTDLLQGTLDVLILKTLALEPMHG
jgi:hypothetical protein